VVLDDVTNQDKQKQKKQDKDGKKNEKPKPPCRVRARVVDSTGQPVAKVGVVLAKKELQTLLALNEPTFRGDADGKVEFTFPPREKGDTTRFTMLLTAPGRLAYARTLVYPKDKDKPELDLGDIILGRGVMLQGQVRGEDGRPVVGAKVNAGDSMGRSMFTRYGNTDRNLRYQRSHAISDKRGTFMLPGVHAAAMHLTISADGYQYRELPAVSIRQPLDVTLCKTGFVTGKVVDDKGQPIDKAYVRVTYEVDPASSSDKTDKDGAFKISLRHPHRYRLYAYVSGDQSKLFKRTYSEVLDAPTQDLVIKLERLAEATPAADANTGILLRVTDAATGGVVEKFKAAALWINIQWHTQERYVQSQFRSQAKEAKMPGELRLSGPKENQPQTGLVIVEAKGYAQLKITDVNWSEEELVKLDAKMSKESSLAGVVIDETTKKPVAGAKVYVVSDDPDLQVQQMFYGNRSPDKSNAVTTDDKGAFRLGGLGKGRYKVHVAKTNRPAPKPLKVELKEAEQRGELSLAIPRGTTLAGKIVGAEPQSGWRVKLVPRRDLNRNRGQNVFYSYSPYSQTPGPTTPLGNDGKFEFKGLARGAYDLRILIPRGARCGPPVEIFVDPLRLRKSDITRDFDASEDRPARIKGKLKVTGAPIPLDRLVVVAADFGANRYYYGRMDSSLMGARSLLKRDGTFDLLVNKGIHQLKVVDLETGIAMLKLQKSIEVEAGQTVTHDLELAATVVRVTLKPVKEGDKIVASHLDVNVQHPKSKAMGMVFGSSPNNTGVGISLADGKRKINLFLPVLETKLAVRSNTQRLNKARSGNPPTLAEHEFTPKPGETNKVELTVTAPAEIKDPEEGDPKAADEAAVGAMKAAAGMARVLQAAKDKAVAEKAKQAEPKKKAEPGKKDEPKKEAPKKGEPETRKTKESAKEEAPPAKTKNRVPEKDSGR